MDQTTPASPFAALPANPTTVVLAGSGRSLAITPIRLGELGRFAAACAPLIPALQKLPDPAMLDWVNLVASHSATLLDAISIAARLPAADVAELDLADSVTLIEAIVTINADFFSRQVLPKVQGAAERMRTLSTTSATSSPT